MYVEKRSNKNKVKYYLAHSFREGRKVHKIRKFLGVNLDSDALKDRIAKAEKIILEEIREYEIIGDPIKLPLSKKEIDLVNGLEAREKLKVFHLSDGQWRLFSELFTYNTNAIEGSELSNKEVKEILEENKWPKKPKQDIAEAYGVNEAINFIRESKEHVSIAFIKELHKLIFKNSKEFAGYFRKAGEEVAVRNGLGSIAHYGAPSSRVSSLLKELIGWYNKNNDKYPAIILASVVHNQFENIHPFKDGNGRVGRLLLNNILIKNGLPPINIDFKNRAEYYVALQKYEKESNLRPTINLIIKEYKALKRKFG